MKKIFTLIILLSSIFLYAQNPWVFNDKNSDIGASVYELKQFQDNSILSLSRSYAGHVRIHDLNTGEIINGANFPKDTIIDGTKFNSSLKKVFFNYDSELIYIFGGVNYVDTIGKSYLSVKKLDFDLNLVSDTLYKVSDTCFIGTLEIKQYEDEYCVFAGMGQKKYNNYYLAPFVARFDLDLNLIDKRFITSLTGHIGEESSLLLKKQNDMGYWSFDDSEESKLISYDDSFNILEIRELADSFDLGGGYDIGGDRLDDSTYIVDIPVYDYNNGSANFWGTEIVKFDNNMKVIKSEKFVPQGDDLFFTFLFEPIDWYYKDQIYTAGFYHGGAPGYFCISKYDSNLNLIWRKFIGYKDNQSYLMVAMEATSDSCVVVAGHSKVYIPEEDNFIYSPFIMKISPNGNTVSTADIEKSDYTITVYPNPSLGDFKIHVDGTHKSTKLYISDMQGRKIRVQNNIKQGENHLNFSDIPKGIYIWTLEGNTGVIGSGKWIKK